MWLSLFIEVCQPSVCWTTVTETTISNGLSKFINFQNRKIRNLLSIATAKVELIDDISNQFTGITTETGGQIVGVSSFRLTTQSGAVPLFNKIFNGV